MKQYEAVILAMSQNDGYATLGQLYQLVPKIPNCKWETKTPFASIRRIVQTHKEFFRIRSGLWGLTAEKNKIEKLFIDINKPIKEKEYSHYFYQGLITEIGKMKGFSTFIPNQDKNKPYVNQKLGDISDLSEIYAFTYPNVMQRVSSIDVSWFNSRKYPDSLFEIEHTTDIYNSLLKFFELQDFRINFYIVADILRKPEFENKVATNAFSSIKSYVKFWNYEDVSDLHDKLSASYLVQQALI